MELYCEKNIYSVRAEEHMTRNDFFLRWVEVRRQPEERLLRLRFQCFGGGELICETVYGEREIQRRLDYAREELARYRDSSLPRILGRADRPAEALMHEYFSFYSFVPADTLRIVLESDRSSASRDVTLEAYVSLNRYCFPLRGCYLVSDTYPSINSHRWCRNSEFAMDVGAFQPDLVTSIIAGETVYAAGDGIVAEVFDGLEDTNDAADLAEVERRFGEHARIDGNHILLRHENGEYTLYAHLKKGSVRVKPGERVTARQPIGAVGSSGSSAMPHLHFHAMLEGIEGPGIPIRFTDLVSFFGDPCDLSETTNIVKTLP